MTPTSRPRTRAAATSAAATSVFPTPVSVPVTNLVRTLKLLQEAGYAVVGEAGDGEEAQSLIQKEKPDVAVLDIQMPKASGIEVTRWVRAHLPEVGVLILTAYDDDPYVMAVLQAGANGSLDHRLEALEQGGSEP